MGSKFLLEGGTMNGEKQPRSMHRHASFPVANARGNGHAATCLLAAVFLAGLAVVVPLEILRVGEEHQLSAQRAVVEQLLASLKQDDFDAAVEAFSPTLLEVFPAKELKRIWDKFGHQCGAFEGALACDPVCIDGVELLSVRGRWEKAVMEIRLAFDRQNRIDGFWLARDRQGPTPEHFYQGGYAFGDVVTRLRAGLTVEVRVLAVEGDTGQETQQSASVYIHLLRAVEGPGGGDERVWHDPATGKAWKVTDKYREEGHGRFEQLEPGLYRAEASQNHVVGISAPLRVDREHRSVRFVVSLLDGPTVTLRPVDAETGEPVLPAHASMARVDDRFPTWWKFNPTRPWDRGAVRMFQHVPPGRYRVAVSNRASRPEDMEYELVDGPLEIEVVAGRDEEMVLPLHGERLSTAEIEKRWPWSAQGTVTDAEGRPLSGVEIRAKNGVWALWRTVKTVTDSSGRYTIRFQSWMFPRPSEEDPEPANILGAYVSAHHPGMVEQDLNQQGRAATASRLPRPDECPEGVTPEQAILPHQPRRLDFVMVPAAALNVSMRDERGQPLAGNGIRLTGKDLPPTAPVLPVRTSNEEGHRVYDQIPPGFAWSFEADVKDTKEQFKSPPVMLDGSGEYSVTLARRHDATTGIRWLEIVDVTDPDGRDIRAQAVLEDPYAQPPVAEALQAQGREILRQMARANRDWLLKPAADLGDYAYHFHLGDEPVGGFRVSDNDDVHPWIRQGISFTSTLHHLAEHPDAVSFRQVEIGPERITLVYHSAEPMWTALGMGLYKTWMGFSSGKVYEGRLVLDAATFTPLENEARDDVERPSDYVEIDPGRYVPRRIMMDGRMSFDWRFQVYQPGLWLFKEGYFQGAAEDAGPTAYVDHVRVNGKEAHVLSSDD